MTKRKLNIDLLDEDSAIQAIEIVGELAEANGIDYALVGGLAMAFYGSPRLTKDIDIIATRRLPAKLSVAGQLKQGGERLLVETDKRKVSVDWIIRNDEAKPYFQAALKDAYRLPDYDIPILTPEWLVILKFIAGRFRDQEDAVFLLSQKGLVNRRKIKELIVNVGGEAAWILAKATYQRWYDLADSKLRSEQEGYIDS